MISGWIKIHRKFLNWEWYDCPNTSRLFIHCLLLANHEDKKWRGEIIKRGSFITSLNKLSEGTKLSLQNVRTSLKNLEDTGEVTRKSTNKLTKLTICEYDTYQNIELPTNTQTNKQLTINQQTTNNQITTTKEDKELKELKEDKNKELFDIFRKSYPGTKRGLETEFSNFQKKHKDWKEVLPDLSALLKCQINQRGCLKQSGQFVPEWKHLQTWINQRCWEDEFQSQPKQGYRL